MKRALKGLRDLTHAGVPGAAPLMREHVGLRLQTLYLQTDTLSCPLKKKSNGLNEQEGPCCAVGQVTALSGSQAAPRKDGAPVAGVGWCVCERTRVLTWGSR